MNAIIHKKTDLMSQPRREQSVELRNELEICLYGKGTLYNSALPRVQHVGLREGVPKAVDAVRLSFMLLWHASCITLGWFSSRNVCQTSR